jgi:hypothetical protein
MKYNLRSLMIVAIFAPPLLALAIVAVCHLLEPTPRPITITPAPPKVFVVTIGSGVPKPPSQPGEIKVTLPESPNEVEETRAMQERKDLEALSASINGLRFHRVPNSSAPAPNPPKE